MQVETPQEQHDDPIPYGYCHCGCGRKTKVAAQSISSRGHVKGEPHRFLNGHNKRKFRGPDYIVDPETGCWVWRLCEIGGGYGVVSVKQKKVYAHRHFYERHVGPIPEGMQIDHLCRNRRCVNPDHLEAVTQRENIYRGNATKLTDEDVAEIRARRLSRDELAEKFGITRLYVQHVQLGVSR